MGGNGAIINTGAVQAQALQAVTLAGNTIVGGSSRFDIRSPSGTTATLSTGGNAYDLTLNFTANTQGTDQFSLTGVNVDAKLGNININKGELSVETTTTGLGDATKTVTLASGTTLQFYANTVTLNKVVVSSGGIIRQGSATTTFSGPITLNAATTFDVAGTTLTLTNAIGGASGIGFNKISAGTLVLGSSANNFTGVTDISAGIMNVASLSDYGIASAIGSRTSAMETATGDGIGLHLSGGTLQYTGATAQSTNRQIRILNGVTPTIDASGSVAAATVSFTYSGVNTNLFDTSGTRTLNLTGTNTGNNLFAIQLTNQAASATSLTKAGAGTWVVTNTASSFTGPTTINGGVLSVPALANGGLNSPIGASTNASANLVLNGGNLRYTGGNTSTDRGLTLTGSDTFDVIAANTTVTVSGLITGAAIC